MRKLTKVLVLVAAFTALFALTAFAKTGWNNDANGWYYVGTDGEWIKGERKNSNGKVYYLDDETGYMVTNKAVEIEDVLYYFGEDGAMVKNQWVLLPADEDDETGEENRWYRFGSTGKAVTAQKAFKVGDQYYGFDAEGKMLFGFVDDDYTMINDEEDAILKCTYWYGDNTDGAMKTGWIEYLDGFTTIDKEKAWFYFKPKTGVKYARTAENDTWLIGQKKYTFDENGMMETGWAYATPATPGMNEASQSYWNADGTLKKNSWVYATQLTDSDSKQWYYLNGSGYPNKSYAGTVQNLKKKFYVFNADAKDPYMLSGLVYLTENDIATASLATGADGKQIKVASLWDDVKKAGNTNLYYFSKNENAGGGVDGWAVTGAVDVDFDDTTVTLNFDKHTFCALHGVKDGKLYNFGQLQTTDDGYAVKKVGTTWYFVGSAGKLVTKIGKYKDASGNYFVKTDAEAKVPQYYVADDEYAYKDAKGNIKYANASTVAKKLYDGDWDEMNPISKKAADFAAAMDAKME